MFRSHAHILPQDRGGDQPAALPPRAAQRTCLTPLVAGRIVFLGRLEVQRVFERLKAAIEAALDAATSPQDKRDVVSGMREAVIEAHAAVQGMREDLARTEKELAEERRSLEDAVRRGQLAKKIDDQETVDVADRFVAKHQERVEVLEQKLEAQKAEIVLSQRELDEMKAQMKKVAGSSSVESAWREIEAAGGSRPETDVSDDLLKQQFDQAAREAHADAQLEALKKKMGR